jgi:hypothetical protein
MRQGGAWPGGQWRSPLQHEALAVAATRLTVMMGSERLSEPAPESVGSRHS